MPGHEKMQEMGSVEIVEQGQEHRRLLAKDLLSVLLLALHESLFFLWLRSLCSVDVFILVFLNDFNVYFSS